MRNTINTSKLNYTKIERNIYRTENGTYRVRVNGHSKNAPTRAEARLIKRALLATH